jgi:FimV-like protein
MDHLKTIPALAPISSSKAVHAIAATLVGMSCVLGSHSANAVSLSRPQIQSEVGQALRVQIDLSDISSEESADLQASFAEPANYKASGITVNPALEDAKLTLVSRADGSYFIQIQGTKPVADPFIDLLINLKWATGSVLRDIGLLLESPKTEQQMSANQNPVMPSRIELTVKAGDTAGKIALQNMDRAQLSLDQMLVALIKTNPAAFINNNVNLIKAGAKLSIPSAQEAAQIDQTQAQETIAMQASEFANYKAQLAANMPTSKNPVEEQKAQGRVSAMVNDMAPQAKDQLKLSTPDAAAPNKEPSQEEKMAEKLQDNDSKQRSNDVMRNIEDLNKVAQSLDLNFKTSGLLAGLPALRKINNLDDLNAWVKSNFELVYISSFVLGCLFLLIIWIRINKEPTRKSAKRTSPATYEGDSNETHIPPSFHSNEADPSPSSDSTHSVERAPEPTTHAAQVAHSNQAPAFASTEQATAGASQSAQNSVASNSQPSSIKFNFDLELPSGASSDETYLRTLATPVLMPAPAHSLSDTLGKPLQSAHTTDSSNALTPNQDNALTELEDPFKVRLDLAEELWKLGQKHTGRALAQEVAEQASPEMQEQARQWLATHL